MNGNDFSRLIDQAYGFFLKDFGFVMDELVTGGRFYSVMFTNDTNAVCVSHEPGDVTPAVLIFTLTNGRRSNIDDRSATPRLTDLNTKFMNTITKAERAANDLAFKSVSAKDPEERQLLKAAKELRLVLPKYLGASKQTIRTIPN